MGDEAIAGIGEAVDQALYGRRNEEAYGEVLYQIKEEKRKCCSYTAEIATFYQDFVVICNASQQWCFPSRYEETIMPKYKLCGAEVQKGVNWSLLVAGFMLTLIGIVLLMQDNEDLQGLSIAMLLIGIVFILSPMCMVRYITTLHVMADPDDPLTPPSGYHSYFLRTFKKPDDDFIMQYVYGSLHTNMPGYHALSHLLDDHIVSRVKPRMMTAVQIDADQVPPPPLPQSGRAPTGVKSKGYGAELYVLEQTTGMCGDDVSIFSKIGTTCLKNTTRAVFHENVLVMQTKSKILCYPETYNMTVIPKYRIASCEFRKGGSYGTLSTGAMTLGFGVFLIAIHFSLEEGDSMRDVLNSLGIVFAIVGLIIIIVTLFFSTYTVALTLQKKAAAKNESFSAFFKRLASKIVIGQEVISLTLAKEPDKPFIMKYVYGCLGKNMGGYHALTHLVKDGLVETPEPRTIMGAIASTGITSYVPTANVSPQADADHGEVAINVQMNDTKPAVPVAKVINSYTFGDGPIGMQIVQQGSALIASGVDAGTQAAAQAIMPGSVIVGVNNETISDYSLLVEKLKTTPRPLTMQIRAP